MKRAVVVAAVAVGLLALPSPASAEESFYAVRSTPDDELIVFDPFSPAPRDALPLSGLDGRQVVALDSRWSTGGLYGVVRTIGQNRLQVVRINQETGVLTPVGPVVTTVGTSGVGMAIHPYDDVATVVTASDDAFGVDLETGGIVTVPSPNPSSQAVVANAYTAPNGGIVFGLSVDAASDTLRLGATGSSISQGTLATTSATIDVGNDTSLDMSPDGITYLETRVGSSNRIYTVDPINANATELTSVTGAVLNGFTTRQTGPVRWASQLVTVGEGIGTAKVTLVRTAPASGPAVVRWATVDGSARAGRDFTASSGTVTFARGQTTAQVSLPVRADRRGEPTEALRLRLSSPDGVATGPDATVRVLDDDDRTRPVTVVTRTTVPAGRRMSVPFALSERARVVASLILTPASARRAGVRPLLDRVVVRGRPGARRATFVVSRAVARRLVGPLVGTVVLRATDAGGNTGTARTRITLTRR